MRCNKCGWPNPAGCKTCVKCGSPLEVNDNVFGKTIPLDDNTPMSESDMPQFRATMINNQDSKRNHDEQQPSQASVTRCPKCGYPLRNGVTTCPNCGYHIVNQESVNAFMKRPDSSQQYVRRPTRMDDPGSLSQVIKENGNSQLSNKPHQNRQSPIPNEKPQPKVSAPKPKVAGGAFRGTVNPYMMNYEPENLFYLEPVRREGERHEAVRKEYVGDYVVLKRDNTEPNNSSITSREQAVISFENGKWYIEDHSDQKTTFVQAGKKTILHDGDIILMGNRMFVFHE